MANRVQTKPRQESRKLAVVKSSRFGLVDVLPNLHWREGNLHKRLPVKRASLCAEDADTPIRWFGFAAYCVGLIQSAQLINAERRRASPLAGACCVRRSDEPAEASPYRPLTH